MSRKSLVHKSTKRYVLCLLAAGVLSTVGVTSSPVHAADTNSRLETMAKTRYIAQHIPEHPENGDDPTPERWQELMDNWNDWFGLGGYGVGETSNIIPGTKIWPKASDSTAVWPKGSDRASLNHYINRRIEYRDQETNEIIAPTVKQQVHYGETMIIDLVTGENLGYAAHGGTKPITRLKTEGWYQLGSTTFNEIVSPDLSSKGYDQPTQKIVPAVDTKVTTSDSKVIVYFPHHIKKNKEIKNVSETIHYVFSNGSKAANDYKASITFNRMAESDSVTGKTTYSNWNPANLQSFAKVASPIISGYKADVTQVEAFNNITADTKDIVKTITYSPVESANNLKPNGGDSSEAHWKANGSKEKALPQTGEKSQGLMPLMGVFLIATIMHATKLRKKS